jgi:hypothetical protein
MNIDPTARRPLDSPRYDLAGFGLGLATAWYFGWQTRDLVWTLWLSSLVIGYATIVLGIAGGVRRLTATATPAGVALALAGAGFLLAFFTVHFGLFHVVHSVFLNLFFPLVPAASGNPTPTIGRYVSTMAGYSPWLLAAAVAERTALVEAWRAEPKPGAKSLVAFDPGSAYRNVIRMHLLIFFFAGASILKLENLWVYAVVYVVYFFPWRLLKRTTRADAAAGGG